MSITPSVSEWYYTHTNLFKVFIFFASTFCWAYGTITDNDWLIVAGFFYAGVYAARAFHQMNIRKFHYIFASVAFLLTALAAGSWIEIAIAFGVAVLLKLLKQNYYVFAFEMIAGFGLIFNLLH